MGDGSGEQMTAGFWFGIACLGAAFLLILFVEEMYSSSKGARAAKKNQMLAERAAKEKQICAPAHRDPRHLVEVLGAAWPAVGGAVDDRAEEALAKEN